MKSNVAVIYGGPSSERQISILSGRYAASVIDRDRYNVYEVLFNTDCWQMVEWDGDNMSVLGIVDKGDFSCNGIRFDVACIMIHGIPGENGLLQGYFEMMGIPVTTCSSFVCTIAFNKYSCKRLLLIEKAVTGRELTQAIYMDGGEAVALPITEIVTSNEYFDYDAKYNGKSEEICPAPISEELAAEVTRCTKSIYSHLGATGLIRIDYIAAEDGVYFLEINATPGMTRMSLVPKMVRVSGRTMTEFFTALIDNALRK